MSSNKPKKVSIATSVRKPTVRKPAVPQKKPIVAPVDDLDVTPEHWTPPIEEDENPESLITDTPVKEDSHAQSLASLPPVEDEDLDTIAAPTTAPLEQFTPTAITDKLILYFRDTEQAMADAWNKAFTDPRVKGLAASKGFDLEVDIKCGSIFDFKDGEIDALVSPCTSYGMKTTGVDAKLVKDWQGVDKDVLEQINKKHKGMLPVGRAMLSQLTKYSTKFRFLVSSPTTHLGATNVADTINPFMCFKAVLEIVGTYNSSGKGKKIVSIACAGLGTGIGGVSPFRCALQMRAALDGFFGRAFTGRNPKEQREYYILLKSIRVAFDVTLMYKP